MSRRSIQEYYNTFGLYSIPPLQQVQYPSIANQARSSADIQTVLTEDILAN